MRKHIRKLVEKSDCILMSVDKSMYYFYTDFEKRICTSLFCADTYVEDYLIENIKDVILKSEAEEIKAMIKDGSVLFEYDSCLDNPAAYAALMNEINQKKTQESKAVLKDSSLESIRQYYAQELKQLRNRLNEIDDIIANVEKQTKKLSDGVSHLESKKKSKSDK